MEKGATAFDKLCHKIFAANGNGTNYMSRGTGVSCGLCGAELEAYYCEEHLYLVECHGCKVKALVMAGSPKDAAYRTFGHLPINDPPSYAGSVISCDFPDDVVCGMYLPCPGTDGSEIGKKVK